MTLIFKIRKRQWKISVHVWRRTIWKTVTLKRRTKWSVDGRTWFLIGLWEWMDDCDKRECRNSNLDYSENGQDLVESNNHRRSKAIWYINDDDKWINSWIAHSTLVTLHSLSFIIIYLYCISLSFFVWISLSLFLLRLLYVSLFILPFKFMQQSAEKSVTI